MSRCVHCGAKAGSLPVDYQVLHWPPAFLVVKPSEDSPGLFVVVHSFPTEVDARRYIGDVLHRHQSAA